MPIRLSSAFQRVPQVAAMSPRSDRGAFLPSRFRFALIRHENLLRLVRTDQRLDPDFDPPVLRLIFATILDCRSIRAVGFQPDLVTIDTECLSQRVS